MRWYRDNSRGRKHCREGGIEGRGPWEPTRPLRRKPSLAGADTRADSRGRRSEEKQNLAEAKERELLLGECCDRNKMSLYHPPSASQSLLLRESSIQKDGIGVKIVASYISTVSS